jgi:phthiocerol/phenolphthiocerol synthesis type-I polyketide synthase E
MGGVQPIAVIGMAGRFPAADNIDEFWQNLLDGRDCLSTPSDEDLLAWGEDPHVLADPSYVRRRPRVNGADTFDAELFGLTPREAELADPQHRLFLEVLHSALEHGGYDPKTHDGRIGLYAGGNVNRYRYDNVERNPGLVRSVGELAVSIGGSPDYLATFCSYKLGLRGPSMTVLTACSTSLVAVHVACAALRSGDCDMAVAGGVDLEFPLNLGYLPLAGGVDAQDGIPRPFDRDATGTNFGNGAGAVLLKPLAAALADRDTVYAVIRGSAINNDGDRKVGFTAPSVAGQSECIKRALHNAGVDPRDISYVEAHATATPVGDPIELTGLIEAYRAAARAPLPHQYCDIGTVKSNIGHLSQAAGVAGLIKTVLALWHEQIPPSINVRTPNPATDWDSSPFRVVVAGRPWPRTPGAPRQAGVSSFGIGGTNAHVIVEEAPAPDAPALPGAPASPRVVPVRRAEAVLWSTVDEVAAQQLQDRLATYFDRLPVNVFPHAAHTLRTGRSERKVRRAVIAREAHDAAAALADPPRVLRHDGLVRSLAFAFPGQGAQRPRMLQGLYAEQELFRRGCDAAFDVLDSLLDLDLRKEWESGDEARLGQTIVAQPLLFTLEYALAHCLLHWGVRPRLLLGHSLGELVAAAVAGVFDFESGLRAVAARARLMQQVPPGRMIAVGAPADEVAAMIGDECAVAAINGERQVVVAGPTDTMRELPDRLRTAKLPFRPLRTSHAFHTQAMAEAARQWEEVLGSLTLHEPELTVISAATGQPVSAEQATSPGFWSAQLVRPVNFHAAAACAASDGPLMVVEVGPGRTLTSLLLGRPDLRANQGEVHCLAPESADGASDRLEETMARIWVAGSSLGYWRDLATTGYRRVGAPGYPYQRRRYWVDPAPEPATDPAAEPATDPAAEPAAVPGVPAAAVPGAPAAAVPGVSPARRPTEPAVAPATGVVDGSTSAVRASWAIAELEWFRDRAGRPPGPQLSARQGCAAVFGSGVDDRRLRSALGRAGYQTAMLDSGDGFDPTDERQWTAGLQRLGAEGFVPDLVVHAGLLAAAPILDPDRLDDELDRSVHSLYACAKAVIRLARAGGRAVRLLVLARHLVDVSGGELVNPAAATAPALLRSLAMEVPELPVFCRDVAAGTPTDVLAQEIAGLTEPFAAVRGTSRWLPRLRDLPMTGPPEQSRLRYRGTYLITGGLGGIGLVVARALAATGLEPRLGLLGRSGVSAGQAPAGAVRAELAAMAALGAQVEMVTADVGDRGGLASAVAAVEHRLGPINGVVHSAGVAGGGLVERRDPDDVRRVLHAKTRGVCNLEEVFAGRAELDFLLLFSSQNAVGGLYGSADNAAGNAFLDAHARTVSSRERFTLSIQWPAWGQVGMAARSNIGMRALTGAVEHTTGAVDATVALELVYEPDRAWEFTEHTAGGMGVLPGTALVELVLIAVRRAGRFAADQPLALHDVVFLEIIHGTQPVEVRVLLSASGEGYRFRVRARPVGAGEWVDRAQGSVEPAGPRPAGAGDPEQLLRRLPKVESLPIGFADWLEFGPRWQCAVETWGDLRERLTRFRLPAPFHGDLAAHPLHPAVMDAATAILHDAPPGESYVPFHYRLIQVYAPLPADVLAYARFGEGSGARPRPIDLDFYDGDSGELLVRVVGFTRRGITGEAAAAATDRPAAVATAADPRAPGLLAPADGAAAFLSLLSATVPPVVMVEPPGGRFRAAGIRWADAPTTALHEEATSAQAAAESAAARSALPPATQLESPPERDETKAVLRKLWSEALGLSAIADSDDFFEVGGNSLIAVTLVNRIREQFDVDLGAGALFEFGSINAIAAELSRLTGDRSV